MALTLQSTPELRCELARGAAGLDDVFRLRYDSYRRGGAVDEIQGGLFRDKFDGLPNQFYYVSRNDSGVALATVRISVLRPDLGWTGTPATQLFEAEPAFQEMAKTSLVEASRLCFADTARRDTFHTLMGHMAADAERFAVEWLAACPRVEHAEIYQRLYGFRPLAQSICRSALLGIRLSELRELSERAPWLRRAWDKARKRV